MTPAYVVMTKSVENVVVILVRKSLKARCCVLLLLSEYIIKELQPGSHQMVE